jgi:hypothetical protein
MTSHENLNQVLQIGKVDDAELSTLLLHHFGYADGGAADGVHFHHPQGQGKVTLIYKGSKIVTAVGNDLAPRETSVLSEKVFRDLVETPGFTAGRCILLSTYKVTGSFINGEKLRILPVPAVAPNTPDLTETETFSQHLKIEYPFVVEFLLRRSTNPFIEIRRLDKSIRKWALLLNAFLECQVSAISRGQARHWIHHNSADLYDGYTYCREGYRFPGFADIGPGFSPVNEVPPMQTMEFYDYFGNPRQELNPRLRIPRQLPDFLRRFDSLPLEDQEKFLRAAFWFNQASNVWRDSKSGAYLAIISAIETLKPAVTPESKCDKCGAPRGKGLALQFKEFLDSLAPQSGDDSALRKELYQMRSKLIHGSYLFQADLDVIREINPQSVSEWGAYSNCMSLGRRALLGWLMEKTGGWQLPQACAA